MPGPRSALATASTPGNAIIDFTSSTALASGVVRLGGLVATVPDAAAVVYKAKALLHWSGVQLNGGATTVVGDDAVQVVAYFGDTTGVGVLSAGGSALISRVATNLDATATNLPGFSAFQLIDPVIIGDLSSTGNINSSEVTLLNTILAGTTRCKCRRSQRTWSLSPLDRTLF